MTRNGKLKVCVYLEAKSFLAKSGFRSAVEQHINALRTVGVEVTERPDHNYDVLHAHFWGAKTWLYVHRAKLKGIPIVLHAHSFGAHDFRDSFTLSNQVAPLFERYLCFFLDRGDAVATCSEYAKSVLTEKGVRSPVHVIPNTANISKFRFDPEGRYNWQEKLGTRSFVFYSAGNIIGRKGVADFLEIAKALPEHDYVWFGERWNKLLTYDSDLHEKLNDCPQNVHMPGFVKDINAAFSAGDALLFPSYTENQPMTILESAALGRALIVRDIPEYQGFLNHGVDCLKARNLEEFIEHAHNVASDPELYKHLQKGALQLAQRHSPGAVGEKLEKMYRNLTSDNGHISPSDGDRETAGITVP